MSWLFRETTRRKISGSGSAGATFYCEMNRKLLVSITGNRSTGKYKESSSLLEAVNM